MKTVRVYIIFVLIVLFAIALAAVPIIVAGIFVEHNKEGYERGAYLACRSVNWQGEFCQDELGWRKK